MKTPHLVLVCGTIIIIAVVVWPTPYRYDHMPFGDKSFPVRINRSTGTAKMLVGTEWVRWPSNTDSAASSAGPQEVPREEWDKITGTASAPGGTIFLNLYNGSSWKLTELQVRVVGKDARGKRLWNRSYRTHIVLEPLSSGIESFTITEDPDMRDFEWAFERVVGIPTQK